MASQEQQAQGNSRSNQRAFYVRRYLEGNLENELDKSGLFPVRLSLTFRGYETLAVLVVTDDEGKEKVAFHSAPDAADTLYGLFKKVGNDGIEWRENKPWKGKK